MIQIPLGHGRFAQIDDCDLELLFLYNWNLGPNSRYPSTGAGKNHLLLHKAVATRMGITGRIDHEDRNPLNCCRLNLRVATASENSINTSPRSRNLTGFKGVSFYEPSQKFRAKIQKDQVTIHIGYFETAEQAASEYDRVARELFGEFAFLNFKE